MQCWQSVGTGYSWNPLWQVDPRSVGLNAGRFGFGLSFPRLVGISVEIGLPDVTEEVPIKLRYSDFRHEIGFMFGYNWLRDNVRCAIHGHVT
jgi:hypothetical protein